MKLKSGLFAVVVGILFSCGGKPAPDPCCSFAEVPAGTELKEGEGALQVDGKTAENFSVHGDDGNQVNYQSLGKVLGIEPGKYNVKVNGTLYPVTVKESTLTKCASGSLVVKGSTGENYQVADSSGNQLNYAALGSPLAFFASRVKVKLNGSVTNAEIKLNEITEIQSGTIVVRGTTDQNYSVHDGTGQQLNYNALEKPLAYFEGSYMVKVNDSQVGVKVIAGQTIEVVTGTLVVKGSTEENYQVLDSTGTQLNYSSLNKPLSFVQKKYTVRVNGSVVSAEVTSGKLTEIVTGTIVVSGPADTNYYVLGTDGNQLNYSAMNKPLAFFPGVYGVRVGEDVRKVTVVAGKETALK